MEKVIFFLISINKISVIAFIITLGFLIYELFLIKKDFDKKKKLNLPNFKEEQVNLQTNKLIIGQPKKIDTSRPNNLILVILFIFSLFFGVASLVGFSFKEKSKNENNFKISPTPIITFKSSKGIKIFDSQFNMLKDSDLINLKTGEEIIIGVETIPEIDVDRARIRVNKDIWEDKDITFNFLKDQQVYYIKYKIATDTSQLKIEAQLHTPEDGWLGDE